MIKIISIFLTFLMVFMWAEGAYADWVSKRAAMACDSAKNIAVIRFDIIWNSEDKSLVVGPILTGGLKDKYEDVKAPYSDKCKLSDGRTLELKDRTAQAYAYGMGGGDPDALFAFLVDGKPIYYWDVWYKGYSQSLINRAIVVLDNKKLISCKPSSAESKKELKEAKIKSENCTDETSRLITGPSEDEKKKYDRDVRIKNYKVINNDPKICSYFLDSEKTADATWRARDDIFKMVERDSPFGILSTASLDINNDEVEEVIYRVHGYAGYFDGSYFVYFLNDKDEKSFPQCAFSGVCPIKSSELGEVDYIVEHISELWPSAKIISAQTIGADLKEEYRTRYTWIYPASIDGQSYFYFSPNNKYTFPSSVVGKISSDNKYETLCTYKKDAF